MAKKKKKKKNDITEEDLGKSEYATRRNTNKTVAAAFKEATESSRENKSKINYLLEGTERWTPGSPNHTCSILEEPRQVPYLRHEPECYLQKIAKKNANKNLACRAYQKELETQEHVLVVCPAIHNSKTVEKHEIFVENLQKLAKTANKIATVIEKL